MINHANGARTVRLHQLRIFRLCEDRKRRGRKHWTDDSSSVLGYCRYAFWHDMCMQKNSLWRHFNLAFLINAVVLISVFFHNSTVTYVMPRCILLSVPLTSGQVDGSPTALLCHLWRPFSSSISDLCGAYVFVVLLASCCTNFNDHNRPYNSLSARICHSIEWIK